MCLKINDIKPTKKTYFKVFVQKRNKLYYLIRDNNGNFSKGTTPVQEEIPASTEYGFCVWDSIEHAQAFIPFMKQINMFKRLKLIVVPVKCSDHIQSGTCVYTSKTGNTHDILNESNRVEGQAFTFKNITILRGKEYGNLFNNEKQADLL